jgi:hypothetical protein
LTNAFGLASDQLAAKINYLNAVENQTVLSIEDLTIAIPKAGPVVKQLGGSVEDLAFFMTAMKEGGINASEGANALKSGLASMINPSKKAAEFLNNLGINIKGIVEANAGDLKGTVVGFARALDTLDPLNRARAIEQMFGKFQFARLSTLFQNVTSDASQASRALGLAGASVEELAILSERELKKVEDATGTKFKKSMEDLKNQLIPIGKTFLQAATPIVEFVGKVLAKFNNLSDGTKKVVAIIIGVIGGLAPIALMTFGILANGVANLIKFFAMLRGGIAKLNGSNNVLGGGFDYLTNQQIENLAETNALHTSHSQLISTFNVEKAAVDSLAAAYSNASSQARALASSSPGLFNTVPGPAGAVSGLPPMKFATGGVVPGTGNKDTVPALLTPGEVVITKQTAKDNPELVAALQNGSVQKYSKGTGRSFFSQQKLRDIQTSLGTDENTRWRVPVAVREKKYSAAGVMAPKEVNHGLNIAGEKGMDPDFLQSEFGRDAIDANIQAALEKVGVGSDRVTDILSSLESTLDEAVLAYDGTTKSWQESSDKALKAVQERTDLTEKEKEIIQQRVAPQNTEDYIIPSNPVLEVKPARPGKPGEGTVRDERTTEDYLAGRAKKILKAKHPEVASEVDSMEFSHLPGSEYVYGDISPAEAPTANRTTIGPDGKSVKERVGIDQSQLAEIEKLRAEYEAYKIPLQNSEMAKRLDEDLTAMETKAETASPSKRTKRLGKDIADGLKEGLQEGEPGVKSQSSQLSDAAIPTAAETQARVDKMDIGNKAFYDDIDTPELRDERQVLKSQDRQRRKLGASATVDSISETPVTSQTSLLIDSTARTEAAAGKLAVSTEQAATAQSQVVQQIKDESKSRVTIKGNTVNIGKAREDADKAENEAAITRARAAAIEKEQAVQKARKSPTTITDEQVLAAKEKANAAELKAAETRATLAMAEAEGKDIVISEEDVKDLGKVKKIQDKNQEAISNGTQEQGDGLRRIVDGTDETAESTLLVADQTDELASVTGEAVNAQTETAGNLLTGAQITNATTGNMNDVLQSTDMTGIAQDDIAGSSENIAKINRDIEEDKRKIRALGQQELAARMKDAGSIIPDGAQSSNPVFDESKAPSYEKAYDEVMGRDPGTLGPDDPGQIGYTRDKKGQFIFDPETGEPTTLTEKQVTKKKRGMRKEKVGKFSGKAAGALGTATMVAGMAGAPPQVTAALGTAATVAQFAPMIAGLGPIGLAVGAVVALGAGAFMLNKHFNKMAAAAAKFATDLSATRDGLKSIGEITGKVGASEIMDKRRSTSQYGKYDEEIKIDNTFGEKFLGSEVGKTEKKLFQENVKKFGSDKAVKDLSLKLATAVADGVLDSQSANSIAAELALQLEDQKIEMQLVGQLATIIGPDGKNLKDKPLETRALILANANNRVIDAESDIAQGKGNTRENVASVAAYNMNNIEMATMMADQIQVEYETQKKKLEAELASTTNAQKKLDIGKQIAQLDAKNLSNSRIMNAQLLTQIQLQTKSFEKVFSASRFGAQSRREDAYFDATRTQLETTYKGTDQEEAAKKFLNTTEDFASMDFSAGADQKTRQTFQAKMEMLVGSKVLNPTEANNYLELFSGQLDKFDLLFDASVQVHGTSKTKELLNMFSGYTDKKKATEMIAQIALTKTDPAQFDAIMEALKGIQTLDGVTIDMEILLTSLGLEGVEMLKSQMEEIEKLKEESAKKNEKTMDLDAVGNLGQTQKALVEELKANEERMGEYKNLTLEQQAEYLQKLQTQYANEAMMTETERTLQAEKFARQQAIMAQGANLLNMGQEAFDGAVEKFKAEYLAMTPQEAAVAKLRPLTATTVTSKDPKGGAGGGGGSEKDDPLDFLDSLAMRIKMVRDQAFNAKKPIESMLAAFNSPAAKKNVANMFRLFDGLQQKLIALKVPEEFRDYIAGLDAEQLDELMKADLDKKKKGQQGIFTYGAKRDKDGKIVKDKKGNTVFDKSKIVGISAEGKAIMAAYNEAPLDKFNIAQRKVVTDTDVQFKAFNKLKAQGVETGVALETVSDSVLAAAIASSQLEGTDLKKFVEDLKNSADAAEKAAVMSDLLKKNADFKFNSESVPKLAAALKQTGMSVENIQTVLQDPALAKQLIIDLKDGKIQSEAIAEYLKNIKDEKIVEIRGKFNAGDFAAAAAPGMELVSKMFATQEQLIRTGVDERSTGMVARLKDLKVKNEKLQIDIQRITFDFIRPLEKAIEKAQRNIEVNITRKIEDYQEQLNDLQRVIEIAFERPIAAINAENTIMSNDMEIMNKAAEEINKRYDEQAEALSKVAEINSQIVDQEKEQLDLADALSKGDIAAAARAVQSIRASQAARNAENASKALEQSRKNEVDSLRGRDSGLSQEQITERQYQNAQAIYDLENRATTNVNGVLMTRLQILDDIQKKSDEIYKLEEKREAAQLLIRKDEDAIFEIRDKQLKPLEEQLEVNNMQIANDEYSLERLVDGITVLGKTKDAWDAVSAKIEASSLAGQDFDNLMGSMLASVDKIEEGWKSIEGILDKYSSATAAGPGTEMDKLKTSMLKELAENEKTVPTFAPTPGADDPNASYDDPTKNVATDMYSSANYKGPTRSDFGGSSSSSKSGGGSGGSTTVPGPGQKTPTNNSGTQDPNNNTVKDPKAATASTASIFSMKAPLKKTTMLSNALYALTDKGFAAKASAARTDVYNYKNEVADKFDGITYMQDLFTSASLTSDQRKEKYIAASAKLKPEDIVPFRSAMDKIIKLEAIEDSYKVAPKIKGYAPTVDNEKSEAAADAKAKAMRMLPKDVVSILEIIKQLNFGIGEDVANFKLLKDAYVKVKTENLYGESKYPSSTWDPESIKLKDPQAYKNIISSYEPYKKQVDAMDIKSAQGARARSLLKQAGYSSKDFEWYFPEGKNYFKDNGINDKYNKNNDYATWTGYARGGLVSSKFAQKEFRMGSDTVPAMLTPGEFVMNKFAVQTNGIEKMKAINSGSSVGESVYNYSISVNVKSESNPDEIARTVIAQIKSVDAQKIRGVRS